MAFLRRLFPRTSEPDFRAALTAMKTHVMLADASLTITYTNPSLAALLKQAEPDLKGELPAFDADTLIGRKIDVFHKQPAHQRRILSGLATAHAATIRIGTRHFDLLINPLVARGRRTGYVVEWSDAKERLLNLDFAAKITAITRNQAMIDFASDGTILNANERFLHCLGYTLAEIKGQKHAIFVDPSDRASPDYAEFWRKLRAGEPQAGQFRRLHKSGAYVWIEGTYNPVLNERGEVHKVVKVAADITEHMALLKNLSALIDSNFGEIDHAIAASDNESAAASGSAGETLSRVQTVAAGTEQLASSIGEISNNMARTQSAANDAFAQIVSAGESTSRLENATREMTGIVDLIRNVAGQINLLALNATIEAARAGEAGKGFAVVASEVKNLANQSASATTRIAKEIDGIQAISADVARAAATIRDAIDNVRGYVTSAASAVEEQNAVTSSISADMQSAAATVTETTRSIGGIAASMLQVSQAVARTKDAARVLIK